MKTFISVILIFALLCAFVFTGSYFISRSIGRMLDIAALLPDSAEEFKNADVSQNAEKLRGMWQKSSETLSFFASAALIEAADEAMGELYGAYKAGDADGFLPAAVKFQNALQRLSVLFGAGFQSLA